MKRDGDINKKAIIKDDISHCKKSKEENIHVGGLITDGDSKLFLVNDTKNLIFPYPSLYLTTILPKVRSALCAAS